MYMYFAAFLQIPLFRYQQQNKKHLCIEKILNVRHELLVKNTHKGKLSLVYLNIFVKAYGALSTASWYLRWQFWFQTWTLRACPSRRPIGWPPVGPRRPPCTVDRPGCSRSPGRGGSIPGLASQSPAGLSTTSQQRMLIIRFCHARQWYHCERAQIKITSPWC